MTHPSKKDMVEMLIEDQMINMDFDVAMYHARRGLETHYDKMPDDVIEEEYWEQVWNDADWQESNWAEGIDWNS